VNIVIDQETRNSTELALDPRSGDPIVVNHLASFAAPGGDGSVERPFNTFAATNAGSRPNQIIFVHAGSVFTTVGMHLKDGQRFLGEGVAHPFLATKGAFLLPRATMNLGLPKITQMIDCAVHLANDTEVAGFHMEDVGCDAIHGEFIRNVLIRDNFIRNATAAAVFMFDVTGNIVIRNNVIADSGLTGIEFVLPQGSASLLIENNTILHAVAAQVVLAAAGDASFSAQIRNNTFTQTSIASNVLVLLDDKARADLVLEKNIFHQSVGDGLTIDLAGNSQLRASIRNNTFTDAGADSIAITLRDSAQAAIQVAKNTIRGASLASIYAETFDTSNLCMQILGNTVNRDMELSHNAGSAFNLEGTSPLAPFLMATNTFQGGAVANVGAGVTPVAFGFCGFPAP
jgi:hypothetical protein